MDVRGMMVLSALALGASSLGCRETFSVVAAETRLATPRAESESLAGYFDAFRELAWRATYGSDADRAAVEACVQRGLFGGWSHDALLVLRQNPQWWSVLVRR